MATTKTPPVVVIYGDDEHQKTSALHKALDALLPPEVDRGLALTNYDASEKEDQGGPTISRVLEDLRTLPFLSDRRVVVVRDADNFISAHRDALEQYAATPAPTGVLVLECRSFPKTTRLAKSVATSGGHAIECKRLSGRGLIDFVVAEAQSRGKRITPDAAGRLVQLVGQEAGTLASELEKLALYVGDRDTIDDEAVTDLVGLSREEKVFAVADAAGVGRLPDALRLWQQVLDTDPSAAFRALGGFAFVVRRWLTAHQLHADGLSAGEIAPKVQMWGRQRDLETILRRLTPRTCRRLLAALADLDSQAKSGARSIERGIELLLVRLAAPAG